jgi:hypothetical protein
MIALVRADRGFHDRRIHVEGVQIDVGKDRHSVRFDDGRRR